ncbi:type I-D CRISPR-associated protein Cas5/Csc1 [Desulfurispora thermophila]|uniref:type I-D CRISPR-associated protein Cas5/Csc1 n=1 Tax=Desulfurispora thermophila TaxID=265470 RepID=UPI00036AE147|nr:type I-D CRISPR-associated protein Cas5/Csc1 [Desulfurispora thermophila]
MAISIWRARLKLLDYLFFATYERGKLAETGPFIHNYALTYALGLAGGAWYCGEQTPSYLTHFIPLNQAGCYVTPATMLQGEMVVLQYNTINEGYTLGRGRNIGYPNWGFVRAVRPGAMFDFFVLLRQERQMPAYIRLGKFMAKARVTYEPAVRVQPTAGGRWECSGLLNPLDLPVPPVHFAGALQLLPGNLLAGAVFQDEPGYEATFPGAEKIWLPARLAYLAALANGASTPGAGPAAKKRRGG